MRIFGLGTRMWCQNPCGVRFPRFDTEVLAQQDDCATACLEQEHSQAMTRCIQLDRICADLCSLAARAIARRSDFVRQACALCALACQSCGKECAKRFHSERCKRCAPGCRRCKKACQSRGCPLYLRPSICSGRDGAVHLLRALTFVCASATGSSRRG